MARPLEQLVKEALGEHAFRLIVLTAELEKAQETIAELKKPPPPPPEP